MAKRRNPRVDHAVREALAELLDEEVADPRVRLVTITDVRVTEDHKQAVVHYTTLDPQILARDPRRARADDVPDASDVAEGLASAAPRLQGLLARRVRMRNTPILEFRPDAAAAEGRRIDELLRTLGDDGGE